MRETKNILSIQKKKINKDHVLYLLEGQTCSFNLSMVYAYANLQR